jgi:glutathione S-transferase
MLSLLRYRRLAHTIIWANPDDELDKRGIKKPRVSLLPTFIFDADKAPFAMVDSTPIIRKLEALSSARSVIPTHPVLAFLDYLLEDFADEWCTKYMFHYRWHFARDADNAGSLLPLCTATSMPSEDHRKAKTLFTNRQVERLYVVGSNEFTAPVIDASFRRFLCALEAHLATQPFLLGARPGACDFAVFGQLSQLIGFDPTPRDIAHELSPRAVAWVLQLEDLSGIEPHSDDWLQCENLISVPPTLHALLAEVGRVYVPALRANARALEAGQSEWEAEIDGTRWAQKSFAYQGKCLVWINQQYQALSTEHQQQVDALLSGTGCKQLFIH